MSLESQLERDEGVELKPYLDTVGKWTIGIGRNLSDNGISIDEARQMLKNDIAIAKAELSAKVPVYSRLDAVRRDALVNMVFNLGMPKLLGFMKFIAALEAGDYKTASTEMLDSKWAQQVGDRALRLAKQIETGVEQ